MIRSDDPLGIGDSAEKDTFGRSGFAQKVARSLLGTNAKGSFAVSVEGPWGSGKTSTIALIKDALAATNPQPVITDFNPWLVGGREALLKSLFAELAACLEVNTDKEHAGEVARAIRKYSGVLDLGKYIPGGEIPTAIVKGLAGVVEKAAEEIDGKNLPSLQRSKLEITEALAQFDRPIVIIIDDLDRLYPSEIMEMIRVVKTAGDLPKIRYLLAFDSTYVVASLREIGIPKSEDYIDKIIQHRQPIPPLSPATKSRLVNKFYGECSEEVRKSYFVRSDEALAIVYNHGIRNHLQQPRDFIRVFNTFDSFEEGLRGEVRVGDILGLATLYVKAQPVYDLLMNAPQAFVGRVPTNTHIFPEAKVVLESYAALRQAAYDRCSSSLDAKLLAHSLFPQVAEAEDGNSIAKYTARGPGAISSPERLIVALQQIASSNDVSLVMVRSYIDDPGQRDHIVKQLSVENCIDFLGAVHDILDSHSLNSENDRIELALHLATLPDEFLFVAKQRENTTDILAFGSSHLVSNAIRKLLQDKSAGIRSTFSDRLCKMSDATSYSSWLLVANLFEGVDNSRELTLPEASASKLVDAHVANVRQLASAGSLFSLYDPYHCLRVVARLRPKEAPSIFKTIQASQEHLDDFVRVLCEGGRDSVKGWFYMRPEEESVRDDFEKYATVDFLVEIGAARLKSGELTGQRRAAWIALVENKKVYGVDCSSADQ